MATPFNSLDDYIALPRTEGLALSPDGTRAVLTIATLKKDGTGYERALWAVPADGSAGASRLTRSAKGESSPAFTASGDVLFASARPDGDEDGEASQIWILPVGGGEARPVTAVAGGVDGIAAVAAASDRVIVSAGLLPGADGALEEHAKLFGDRKEHKVAAILHETYPVRFWDHDLGPAEQHLLALDLGDLTEPVGATRADEKDEKAKKDKKPEYPASLPRPRDLTPRPGHPTGFPAAVVAPDGSRVVAMQVVRQGNDERMRLVSIDTATGELTPVADEPGYDVELPAVSHDGSTIAYSRTAEQNPVTPTQMELWVAAIDGSGARRVAAEWDRWPSSIQFTHDDSALVVTADQDGRGPIFRIPLDGSPVEQVTDDDFTYSSVNVDRVTGDLVALRANWMVPLHAVRVRRDGEVVVLASPVPLPEVPASMVEVETTAADGARVRGWLLLPESEAPAPLLLWIHGGPLNSWNEWSWRWNPQLAVARGYAVLLPDPALSTGYGLDFIARGWNAWGAAPYTDLMSITDAVVARPDIDETRTAAMGGSFGGYMANWVAGHTDRFRAIVTHASLWALDQFGPTTDFTPYWRAIMTDEGIAANSPHRFVSDIRTPMLVVHGDRDYRVPIGEGLRLWAELNEHFAAPDGSTPHRFLYFPDENHWVLKPQHAVVWYDTVFAFLAQHVHGEEWARPNRLG
ncbi:S9 family peptidase [Microbacterium sp. ASV49]|uniref:Prolyl oligopeptidase family serine peptidase n=1 Tax=Microbacterium candidum TaxID=3041922 RepID=A0ABT7N1N8_9MICO|nr:alpha/beta fold hydrolase [Microbacterium sp. ASV49]MDL9980617.1 prolyl oligopeptidase family serine peptidase [Microbacterium sp. ASV49]